MLTMSEFYKKAITEAVDAACEVLIKYYPEVFNQKYDNIGAPCKPGEEGNPFKERMQMGLYIELIKARAIK